MSVTQQALSARSRPPRNPRGVPGVAGCSSTEHTWAIAFALPYVVMFLAFVLYPILYGLWLG